MSNTEDFDELLNSLGLNNMQDESLDSHFVVPEQASVANTDAAPVVAGTPTELSEEDISEIFENNGYHENPNAEQRVEEINAQEIMDVPFEDEEEDDEILEVVDDIENIREETIAPSNIPIEPVNEVSEVLIEPNSPTLVMDDSTSRFSGTEWYSAIKNQHVIIAGLGGIGSNVALQISRMHPQYLIMYDPDTVETVNMSGQLLKVADIGKYKSDSVNNVLRDFNICSDMNIYARHTRFTENEEAGPVMICGFDRMSSRKAFFSSWKRYISYISAEDKEKAVFIDGRLSIDTLQVLCMRGDDEYHIKEYEEKYLFSDEEADETICSMKQTTYLACMIGAIMTNLFTNFVASTLHPTIPYNLPFFTEYESQSMQFKTENQWHL